MSDAAMSATAGAAADTATKLGVEFTPVTAMQSGAYGLSFTEHFAKTDCSDAQDTAYVSLDASKNLTVDLTDSSTTPPTYIESTAFKNGATGVTWSSSYAGDQRLSYTLPTMPTNTAQLISLSIANSGWLDVYLQQGAGTETLLGSMVTSSSVAKILNFSNNSAYIAYDPATSSVNSCSKITQDYEAKVRTLIEGTAATMVPEKSYQCPSQDKSSFDTATETLDMKMVSASSVSVIDARFTGPQGSDSDGYVTAWKDFTYKNGGFSDYLSTSTNGAQSIALTKRYGKDMNGYKKYTDVPLASGTIDMSKGDVDGSKITSETSKTAFSAFVHNFAQLTKDKTFTLYIPYRSGDNFVGVCPGASSLSSLTSKCNGVYYLKDGQSKTNKDTKSIPSGVTAKAVLTTINGDKYWEVSGLTGTGGYSTKLASDPDTGFALTAANPTLTLATTGILGFGILLLGRRFARR